MVIAAFACLATALTFTLKAETAMAEESTPPAIDESVIMLYYEDLAAATAFYGGALGLEPTYSSATAKLYQLTATSVVGLIQDGAGYHRAQQQNAVMLSIVTRDVDAWNERLQGIGNIQFLKPISNSTTNPIRAFLVADPGGYTVEFFSWLPDAD